MVNRNSGSQRLPNIVNKNYVYIQFPQYKFEANRQILSYDLNKQIVRQTVITTLYIDSQINLKNDRGRSPTRKSLDRHRMLIYCLIIYNVFTDYRSIFSINIIARLPRFRDIKWGKRWTK